MPSDASISPTHSIAQSPPDKSTLHPSSKQLLAPNQLQKQQKPSRKQSRRAGSSKSHWNPSSINPPSNANDPLHLRMPSRDLTPTHAASLDKMTRRARFRNPWAASWLSLATFAVATALLLVLYQSVTQRQIDMKGGSMSYMASSFVRFGDFDTEHTRFATKYSLHMYRELGVDEDPRVLLGCFDSIIQVMLTSIRSKEFLSSLYPEMLAVTSKSDRLPQKQSTFTTSTSKTTATL